MRVEEATYPSRTLDAVPVTTDDCPLDFDRVRDGERCPVCGHHSDDITEDWVWDDVPEPEIDALEYEFVCDCGHYWDAEVSDETITWEWYHGVDLEADG